MSHQDMEMQFADPDWKAAPSRPGGSPGAEALPVPVEITQAPDPSPQTHEQPAMRLRTPGPGQTPRLPIQPADASNGTGQRQQTRQQSPAPVPLTNRRQRWLLGLLARVALLVIWATTPLVTRAFHGGWIVPLLGVLLLPVTALTYTVVFALAGSVTGLGWLWVVGALLLDLASHAGQTYKRKPRPAAAHLE